MTASGLAKTGVARHEQEVLDVGYITSRRFSLPSGASEMARRYWYNLWRRRLSPYDDLRPGDRL